MSSKLRMIGFLLCCAVALIWPLGILAMALHISSPHYVMDTSKANANEEHGAAVAAVPAQQTQKITVHCLNGEIAAIDLPPNPEPVRLLINPKMCRQGHAA
jgi:hypothetical protein